MSFSLRDYQRPAVKFALTRRNSVIVMKPGRGKTAVMLGTIATLFYYKKATNAVIFTHKRGMTAYRNLTADLPMVYAEEPSDLVSLKVEWERNSDRVFVISTGLLNRYKSEWITEDNPDPQTPPESSIIYRITHSVAIMIIDEVHNYRNYKNDTSIALEYFTRGVTARRVSCTATFSYTDTIDDTFAIMGLAVPGLFPSYSLFRDAYAVTKKRKVRIMKLVATPAGKRRVPSDREITEVVGQKNMDLLKGILDNYVYFDEGSEFTINITPFTYTFANQKEYSKLIRGEGLSSCTVLSLTGEGGTHRSVHARGETLIQVLPDGTTREVEACDIKWGNTVMKIDRGVQKLYTVAGVSSQLTEADIVARLNKLSQYLSTTPEKFAAVDALIDSLPSSKGILIYCQYLNSIDAIADHVTLRYPRRVVTVIKGKGGKFDDILKSLPPDGITIISRVAMQSLDFYYEHLAVYEPVTNPGAIEQLVGRTTRMNAQFREVNISFILGIRTIEHYFYERLLYLMSKSLYASSLKLEHVPYQGLDFSNKETSLRVLKDILLWRKKSDPNGEDDEKTAPSTAVMSGDYSNSLL